VRVALVHPYSWPAVRRGGERYLADVAWWLGARGHDVAVLTSSAGAVVEGARVLQFPVRIPARLVRHGVTPLDAFGAAVLRHLATTSYDVVHSLVPSGALAAAACLQPSVYTVLGHPSPSNPPAQRWSRALLAAGVRSARVTAALSASAAVGVESLTGRRPLVLPPGVRAEQFPVREGPATPDVLLFNGFAADPRKRLHVLLAALPAVLEQRPGTRLQLGGGGSPEAALERLDPGVRRAVAPVLDDLGTGRLEDVPARYRAATVSVLPSVEEAFGLVLVESLVSGVPVVCTSSGGPAEIVTPDVGRIASPDDPGALADAVLEALALAELPGSATACREQGMRWDWQRVGPLHESAYARARA
jgi:phosphatidylinositol alpha-mannosyltransferase